MVSAILLVVLGGALLFFGLRIFYWLLPFMYALVGAGVGFWLGQWFTTPPDPNAVDAVTATAGADGGLVSGGLLPILLALVFAVGFFLIANTLESFRRALIGLGLGASLGALAASSLGITGFGGVVLMIIGAVLGMLLVNALFDPFIIVSTAIVGAGYLLDGLNLLLPNVDYLRRAQNVSEDFTPLVVWVILAFAGIVWQSMIHRRTAGRR